MYPFQRTELLFGKAYLELAKDKKVILFGVGGVGSWCAESLIRAGIGHLTIVDSDVVNLSNINRQLPATSKTIGKSKTEVLKERLLEINPETEISALHQFYTAETAAEFHLNTYDYIIDAIDTVPHKVHLIQTACETDAVFVSSMGAALKTDPSKIKTAEFWKVHGCPLAATLRTRIRKQGGVAKKFLCVFSDEMFQNKGKNSVLKNSDREDHENDNNNTDTSDNQIIVKKNTNGTISYMPAMFGMTLSSLIIRDIMDKS